MAWNDPEPEEEPYPVAEWYEESTRQRPSGCFTLVAIVLIVALLGTSLASVAWLWRDRAQTITRPTAVPTAPGTPAPITESEDKNTAVPIPPITHTTNRIAYINNDGQVTTIAPDGAAPRFLTKGTHFYTFPTWSPDGQQIAAIGSNELGASVFVLADKSAQQQPDALYFSGRRAPFYLYWSPDSQTVSFLANDPAGVALHLAAADGATESRLRTTGGPFYWQWTADSRRLLIHSGFAGEGARLELMEAAGDKEGEPIAAPGYFQAPAISSDGRILAYAEENSTRSSQIVLADRGSGSSQAQRHTGQVALGLSPDSNLLAYISPDAPNAADFIGPLRLLQADTGQTLLLHRERVVAFFWSPDGRFIAAFAPYEPGGSHINVAFPDKGPLSDKDDAPLLAKPVAQSNLSTLQLIIFDVTTGEGKMVLSFTPTFTFRTQFLPFFDQYALSHRIWSPQSDALVLPVLEEGRSYVYIVPADGGSKQFLAEGSMAFWSQQ